MNHKNTRQPDRCSVKTDIGRQPHKPRQGEQKLRTGKDTKQQWKKKENQEKLDEKTGGKSQY